MADFCIYCLTRPAETADHIPPKCLFAKPRPSDLITVPCCLACNKKFERDDTYFRDCLVLDERTAHHPDAQATNKATLRGFARPRGFGYARFFLSKVGFIQVRSPSGLHLGRQGAYDVNLHRLSRVAARVIRGLYYHEQKVPLPTEWQTLAYFSEGFSHLPPWELAEMEREVITPTLSNPPREIGRSVLRYWVAYASDHPHTSSWVLDFYSGIRCFGVTLPPQNKN